MENMPQVNNGETATHDFGETISELSKAANIEVYAQLNASNDKAAKEEFLAIPI